MVNTYFLYGIDSYRIQEKEQELLTQFLAGDNNINLEKIDGTELSLARFEQAVSAMSFFSNNKIVVIENLLTQNKDSELKGKIAEKISVILKKGVSDRLKNLNEARDPSASLGMTDKNDPVTMIFVEHGEPDKREKLYKALKNLRTKELKNNENIFYFGPLSDFELRQWINDAVKKRNFKIDRLATEALAVAVGPNLWRLTNEIEKLILYAKSQNRSQIELQDIKEMVESEFNPNVFNFIEAIATANKKQSVKLLQQFLNNGENENYLLSMIVYQFRTLIKIKDLLECGIPSGAIDSQAKLSPYVVQKSLSVLKNYSLKDLIDYYQRLCDFDVKIKTGQIEAKVAVDLLVAG